MTREEEREKAAYSRYCNDSSVTFGLQCNCFKEGAEWADNNPRTDIIGVDSISFVRMILVRNFHNIAKRYHNVMVSDVPEMNEAFDMVNKLDEICAFAGYEFNDEEGVYKLK